MNKKILIGAGVIVIIIGCIFGYNRYQYNRTPAGIMAKYEKEYLKIIEKEPKNALECEEYGNEAKELSDKIKELCGSSFLSMACWEHKHMMDNLEYIYKGDNIELHQEAYDKHYQDRERKYNNYLIDKEQLND